MRNRIHACGPARDNRVLVFRKTGYQVRGCFLSLVARRARTNHTNGLRKQRWQVLLPFHPQRVRRARAFLKRRQRVKAC